MRRLHSVCAAIVAVLLGATASLHANSYRILHVKSAKATALGEAFVVQGDDPSVLVFNPAGIARLRGVQMNLHAIACNAYTEHEAPDGTTTDIDDEWQFVPSAFVTWDLGRDDMAVGLGVSLPNGLSSTWSDDSFARYAATYSNLTVVDVSLGYGVELLDHLFVGGTLDVYYSRVSLDRMLPASWVIREYEGPEFDVENNLDGEGYSWGFSVGAIYEITPKHSIGIAYRHPFSIDYDGDSKLRLPTGDVIQDAETSIDFPGVVILGYAFRPTARWLFEVNVDWTNWETVDRAIFELDGIPQPPLRQDFDNAFAYKVGLQYQMTDNLALRGGYVYNENATPEETWSPSQPDTVAHLFTAGLGYTWGRLSVDMAAQFVYYEDREIDNDVGLPGSVDGTYENWAPCFSVGTTYRF